MTSASEQTSASKREPGYYWVNSDFKKEFRPRYWNGNLWFVGMDVYVKDDFWQEIDERRIERPSPQQQPDTEMWARFEEWKRLQDKYGKDGWRQALRKGLGQPDELSKALTRIKELETALVAVRGYIGMATWKYVDEYRECLEIIDNAI